MTKPKDTHPPSQAGHPHAHAESGSGSALLKNKEIKKLIDMGVQRGYLTYVEVNELLPPEIITPQAIDEILHLLGENEIEVIDTTKRPKSEEEAEEETEEAPIGLGTPAEEEREPAAET